MSNDRFLAKDALGDFLCHCQGLGYTVYSPQKQEGVRESVVFAPWQKGCEIQLAKATVSPKHLLLPQSEVLFRFRHEKGEEGKSSAVHLEDTSQQAQPTLLFAARPCDARGFTMVDRPYLQGLYADPYYAKRREGLCVLTLCCNSGCESCFCHWTGGGPSSPEGSDILMTDIAEGLVLQAITEKGRKLLAQSDLPEAGAASDQATELRRKAWQSLDKAPDLTEAPHKLKELADNLDFWTEQSRACLSCGACTYVCPTCYCFSISDERRFSGMEEGVRLRSWDTCMARHFTEEASGHNPRALKAQRLQNRINHKYAGYPENWGSFSCSGCGRCVTHCPVGIDIRHIVLAAIALPDTQAKEARS